MRDEEKVEFRAMMAELESAGITIPEDREQVEKLGIDRPWDWAWVHLTDAQGQSIPGLRQVLDAAVQLITLRPDLASEIAPERLLRLEGRLLLVPGVLPERPPGCPIARALWLYHRSVLHVVAKA